MNPNKVNPENLVAVRQLLEIHPYINLHTEQRCALIDV